MPDTRRDSSGPLGRFTRRLHRRYVLLRTLERVAVCVLAACLAASVLIPVLLWRGQSAWTLSLTAIGAGVLAGLVWALKDPPSVIAAAAEADRQLGLADLLATALAVRDSADSDPWAGAVLATADVRCATLSPSTVVLHRLGGRAWAGVGLATSLMITLASLSGSPTATRAGEASRPNPDTSDPFAPAPSVDDRSPDRSIFDRPPSPPRASRSGDEPEETTTGEREQPGVPATATAEAGELAENVPGYDAGVGAGAATTEKGSTPREDEREGGQPSTPADAREVTSGAAATGEGGPSKAGLRSDAAGTSTGSGADEVDRSPPWQNDGDWSAAVERANADLDAGRVPDAYRDLVRDYFDRR